VTVGCVAEVEVVLSAGAPSTISGLDVIISWDPSQLSLVQAIPSDSNWLAAGFLPDPDGINSDLPTIEGDTPDNVDNGDLAPILWQHFRCMWLAHAVEK